MTTGKPKLTPQSVLYPYRNILSAKEMNLFWRKFTKIFDPSARQVLVCAWIDGHRSHPNGVYTPPCAAYRKPLGLLLDGTESRKAKSSGGMQSRALSAWRKRCLAVARKHADGVKHHSYIRVAEIISGWIKGKDQSMKEYMASLPQRG